MPKTLNNALTASQVKKLQAPGTYSDGHGLTLRVEDTGAKRWFQRITIDGKQRNIGIGGYPGVSLADAREAARVNKLSASTGSDPIAAKREAREARKALSSLPTFATAAESVIELRSPTLTTKHVLDWQSTLTRYVNPFIGHKSVDTITTADVLAVLTPIWTAKPTTARNLKHRIEIIMDYAIAQGWRTDNNPASSVAKALPKPPRSQEHHAALPYTDVGAALERIRESSITPTIRLAFEFLVLTAVRAGEVRGATWSEINWESGTWEIPAARMKARRPHRVPLSTRAVEILREAWEISGSDGLIFPSSRNGKMCGVTFQRQVVRDFEIPATVHGFRSSFRDWTIEQTATPWAVCEAALAHNLGSSTETAYARTDLMAKRRELMESWATFVAG